MQQNEKPTLTEPEADIRIDNVLKDLRKAWLDSGLPQEYTDALITNEERIKSSAMQVVKRFYKVEPDC